MVLKPYKPRPESHFKNGAKRCQRIKKKSPRRKPGTWIQCRKRAKSEKSKYCEIHSDQ